MQLIGAVGCREFRFFYSNKRGVTPPDTSRDYCVSVEREQWPGGGGRNNVLHIIRIITVHIRW